MSERDVYRATCNRCGRLMDNFDVQNDFGFEYFVGYGSKHDMEHVRARFCCECFDEMLDKAIHTFKISPVVGEYSLAGEVPLESVVDDIVD